jgi:solute carrier family 35 protein F1/2
MGVLRLLFPGGPPDARWATGLALSQVTALFTATSAISSTALAQREANLPAWQSFFVYVLLAAFYVPIYARYRALESERQSAVASEASAGLEPPPPTGTGTSANAPAGVPASRSLRRYAALAVIDTQANYLIVKAFGYTSLTSVTLLDCAAIPFSMVLSKLALGDSYTRRHVLGGAVSVVGIAILVLADADGRRGGREDEGSDPFLGDVIVLLAALLYASSNVLQESALLDGASGTEVLAHVGAIGAAVSGAQCLTFEYGDLAKLRAATGLGGVAEMATFAISLFAMYSLTPEVLRRCGAAAFNVGMLSSDVWAASARVALFGGFGGTGAAVSFVISFATVSAGLVLFATAGDPLPPDRKADPESRYAPLEEDLAVVAADLEGGTSSSGATTARISST